MCASLLHLKFSSLGTWSLNPKHLPPVPSAQVAPPPRSCPRYWFHHICKITEAPMPNLSALSGIFFPDSYKPKSQRKPRGTQGPRVTVWRQSNTVLAWLSSTAAWICSKEASNLAVFNREHRIMEKNCSHEKRIKVIKESVTGSKGVSTAVDHQNLLRSLVMTSFGVMGYKKNHVLSDMIHDLTAWSHGYSPPNYHPIIYQGNYSLTEQSQDWCEDTCG